MTNREKYNFDDFTLDNYRRLVKLAKEKGFQFILHKDEFVPERKDVIWRHDVEFEPDIALKMAEIEHKEGVHATYFFQLHSGYYNLFDEHYSKVLHQIKDLGHHVGLHFDCRYWAINDEKQLDEYIVLDRAYLEKNLGVEIDTFSFHNTTPFTQSCLAYTYGGLVNCLQISSSNSAQCLKHSCGHKAHRLLRNPHGLLKHSWHTSISCPQFLRFLQNELFCRFGNRSAAVEHLGDGIAAQSACFCNI